MKSKVVALTFGIIASVVTLAALELLFSLLLKNNLKINDKGRHFVTPTLASSAMASFDSQTGEKRILTPVRAPNVGSPSPHQPEFFDPALFDNRDKFGSESLQQIGIIRVPRPNAKFRSIRRYDGKVLYDSQFTFDRFSRRLVPDQGSAKRIKHLLFFGGSFALGEGLNDDQSLAFFSAQLASQYRAYNTGLPGFSPASVLYRLIHQPSMLDGIDEKEGVGIFLIIPDHIARVVGTMSGISTWMKELPCYRLGPNASVEFEGTFEEARPLLTALYRRLSKSSLVEYFKLDFPKIRDVHLQLFARLLRSVQNAYHAKFSAQCFYVVLFPGEYPASLLKNLEAEHLSYLDYSSLQISKHISGPDHIPIDGHPSSAAIQFLAEQMVHDLRLQ